MNQILTDARARSVIAGGIGGLLGWLVAEFLLGQPQNLIQTTLFGMLVGVGIGTVLGAAEGIAIQSQSLIVRGLIIGLIVGAVGGIVGAVVGQAMYAAASGSESGRAGGDGGAEQNAPTSMFSSAMKKRLKTNAAKSGEVEIGLLWDNTNDLDLHVTDPQGARIFYKRKVSSATGGELDVDRNAGCQNVTNEPVEHVVWEVGKAPYGEYRIEVVHFSNCGAFDPTPFKVEVLVDGESKSFSGQISHQGGGPPGFGGPPQHVHTFTRKEQPKSTEVEEAPSFSLLGMIARVFGWTLFGCLVGSGQGITRSSLVAIRNAALGGTIGGAIGGFAFEIVVRTMLAMGGTDLTARLVGFVLLGICIGLSIVIVQRALSALLKVRSGRFEGREIYLDRPEMKIGRRETLEIYLGGDSAIESHHATIRRGSSAHSVVAVEGTVLVNDTNATEQALRNGDVITLGKTRLVYQHSSAPPPGDEKEGAPSTPSKPRKAPPPPPRGSSGQRKSSPAPKKPDSSPRGEVKSTTRRPPPPPPPGKK